MHTVHTLGLGIQFKEEFELTDKIVLRPYSIDCNYLELMDRTISKTEYGFICSISELITFEMESRGDDPELAAIQGWNSQWCLVFLSVIMRKPVYWPLSRIEQPNSSDIFKLTSFFLDPYIFSEPYLISEEELKAWKELYPKFNKLVEDSRLSLASSIAATHFHEPKINMRIAAIWAGIEALLGIDHELRYRIAITVAKFLGNTEKERENIFSETKKLYDGRSKCVHGSNISDEKEKWVYESSHKLLSDLIIKICKNGKIPNASDWESLMLN